MTFTLRRIFEILAAKVSVSELLDEFPEVWREIDSCYDRIEAEAE
ncbi:MAG: hypothetical protein OXI81_20330 [Paracoccaceae bacterium]|nr:hypothetical protein [Paracoccaceae bacterium]